jgi:putative DNA primase/helicase
MSTPSRLGEAGVLLSTSEAKNAVREGIQADAGAKPSFEVPTTLGMHRGAFVRPDGLIGTPTVPLIPDLSDIKHGGKYHSGGTLEDWVTHVAEKCSGNDRLIFAVSAAFAGAILPILGISGFAFQFVGPTSIGKTTILMVAGSVHGCKPEPDNHLGFCETWSTTQNAVEDLAVAHNHGLLLLDETRTGGSDDASRARLYINTIMAHTAGMEKQRKNAGPPRGWRAVLLSSTNLAMLKMAEMGGQTVDDAHRVRSPDIPAEVPGGHGAFQELHGCASGGEFSDQLQEAARTYYGTAIVEFLHALTDELARNPKGMKAKLLKWIDRYRRKTPTPTGSNADGRVRDKFAVVYAAGRLAASYEVLPWAEEIGRAVRACEAAHHGFVRQTAPEDPVARVGRYLTANRKAMPRVPEGGLPITRIDVEQAPGFRRKTSKGDVFLVATARFEREFPETRAVLDCLVGRGLLLTQGRRLVSKHTVREGYRDYVYAIKVDILG